MTTAELANELRTTTNEMESMMALFAISGDEMLMAGIRIQGAEIAEIRARQARRTHGENR